MFMLAPQSLTMAAGTQAQGIYAVPGMLLAAA